MQGHAGALHATGVELGQERFVKMQGRSGRRHRARRARKHSLVTLCIFFRIAVGNVGRQGHMAVLFHQRVRFVAQLEVKQLAIGIGPAPQQNGIKAAQGAAARHEHLAAHQRLFADLHVRHHLMARQHPLDQQLQLTARSFLAKDARLDHLGVVEDQQVAGIQQTGQFMKDAVHRIGRTAIEQT